MDREKIKERLEKMVSPQKYIHSLNVMHTAKSLCEALHEDSDRAEIAGLLHDCAKDLPDESILNLCEKYDIEVDDICRVQPKLLHGPLGAALAEDIFKIRDEAILCAISCHTMGKENMSLLDKIVFITDYIEPDRNFPGVNQIRKIVYTDINKAMIISLERTIKHIMVKGGLIHPNTIRARNYLLLNTRVAAFC